MKPIQAVIAGILAVATTLAADAGVLTGTVKDNEGNLSDLGIGTVRLRNTFVHLVEDRPQ